MEKIILGLAVIVGMLGAGTTQAKEIKICTDNNRWYPFTWSVDNTALGVHVEVVQQALKNLGLSAAFTPMGWDDCLNAAKEGKFDAVVSASYKPQRGEFLHYPDDAPDGGKSKWRITEVEYVFLSNTGDAYGFDGNVKKLPSPVYGPQGYSVVDDLKKEGVVVETAKGDQANIQKLLDSKKGIVITISTIAQSYANNSKFKNKLKVHEKPYTSKSYFMPFSKKGSVDKATYEAIWKEIARLREDSTYMVKMFSKYQG